MAGLLKTSNWRYGMTVKYWIMGSVDSDKIKGSCRVAMLGYINVAAKQASLNNFIKEVSIILTMPQFLPTQNEIYAYIHTLDGQQGRELCWLWDATDEI
jgi:hypothetical protein